MQMQNDFFCIKCKLRTISKNWQIRVDSSQDLLYTHSTINTQCTNDVQFDSIVKPFEQAVMVDEANKTLGHQLAGHCQVICGTQNLPIAFPLVLTCGLTRGIQILCVKLDVPFCVNSRGH